MDGTPYHKAPHYNFAWVSVDTLVVPPVVQALKAQPSDSSIVVNPTVAPAELYIVSITDSMGCSASDSVFIHPVPHQMLVIPNLITPNNDNKNDELFIQDNNGKPLFPGAQLEVYNRWGQSVYKSANYDNNWKAQNITDGVYYYHLQTGCGDDGYKGWLHIMGNVNN
jgi:gliding motility-associated-like protein